MQDRNSKNRVICVICTSSGMEIHIRGKAFMEDIAILAKEIMEGAISAASGRRDHELWTKWAKREIAGIVKALDDDVKDLFLYAFLEREVAKQWYKAAKEIDRGR